MKISGQIEQIFAQAVALDQSGGLRNTIYADNKEVYILNYDHTVLLRFRLRSEEMPFTEPISFRASDYDSNEFQEEEGKIVFTTKLGNKFLRKKSCGRAEYSPEEIKSLFNTHLTGLPEDVDEIDFQDDIISLLDSDLSHIEFSGEKGKAFKLIQRNIYSGGVIEITPAEDGFWKTELKNDFGPIGIKTNDFVSLFRFQSQLKFIFPKRGKDDIIIVRSLERGKRDMIGIVASCLYDEIINIKEVQNGRQEQKIRRRK